MLKTNLPHMPVKDRLAALVAQKHQKISGLHHKAPLFILLHNKNTLHVSAGRTAVCD